MPLLSCLPSSLLLGLPLGQLNLRHSCPRSCPLGQSGSWQRCWKVLNSMFACMLPLSLYFVAVQSWSRIQLFVTPWPAARQAPLSSTLSRSLLKFMSIESVMLSKHLILCRFPSIRVFSNEAALCIGGQTIGASAAATVLPMDIQGWYPSGLTGFISLQSKGVSRVFSSTMVWKHQFFGTQSSLWSNSHIRTRLLENRFDDTDLCR